MKTEETEIKIENIDMIYSLYGSWTDESNFYLTSNDPFDFRNSYGTTLKLIKKDNTDIFKIAGITRESNFQTRRFLLNTSLKESEYRVIGDEIMKIGGFWEVIFGSYAIVNIPKDSTFNLDEILELLPEPLEEITNE